MTNKASPSSPFTASQLIEGIRANDTKVYQYLYRTYGGMIAGHVRKNKGSDEDARETVQVVMLKLWQSVTEGRYQEEGKLGHYIFQLAANTWREELRRRRNRPQEALDDSSTAIKDEGKEELLLAIAKDQQIEAIYEGMQALPEDCRRIIQHYHLKQISLQDIAEQQGMDYNTLRKRIFDCRKKLKRIAMRLLNE